MRAVTPTAVLPPDGSEVAWNEPATLRLVPAVEVRVEVVEARTRRVVAGADVALLTPHDDTPWAEGQTDDAGRIALRAAPGAVRVAASSAGHARIVSPTHVAAAPGLDIVLELVAGARVEGRVTDADGHPVSGAHVRLTPRDLAGPRTTDDEGRYVFEGVAPTPRWRTLTLEADHPHHVPLQLMLPALGDGDVRRIDLKFPAGVRVEGVVREADGQPAAGVLLHLVPSGVQLPDGPAVPASQHVVSGPDGAFALAHVAPGPALLSAHFPTEGTTEHRPLTVPPPGAGALRVDVQREAAAGDAAELVVRVLEADGTPVEDVEVSVASGEDFRAEQATDAQGRCHFAGVPPGMSSVIARRTGWVGFDRQVPVEAHGASHVDLRWGRGHVVGRLTTADGAPAQVTGRVGERGPYGEGLWGTEVDVQTDDDGRFEVHGLGEGVYELVVDELGVLSGPESFGAKDTSLSWVVGTEEEAQRRLPRVRIVAREGPTPDEVFVSACGLRGIADPIGLEPEGPPGVFVLPARPPPHVTLHVFAPGHVVVELEGIALQPGPTPTDVLVDFVPGHAFVGRIVDAAGQGVRQVIVDGPGGNAYGDDDGTFRLDSLPPGPVRVALRGPMVREVELPITVTPNDDVVHPFVVEVLGALEVTSTHPVLLGTEPEILLRPLGHPAAERKASLHGAYGHPDGRSAAGYLHAIEPGRWSVQVQRGGRVQDLGEVEIRAGEWTRLAFEPE